MKQRSYSLATTVQKAFRVLEILGEKQPARPTEIVKQLALSRSNVYRLFSTLQEMGYVEKDFESKYNLSFKIFILGNTVLRRNQLSDVAEFDFSRSLRLILDQSPIVATVMRC